MRQKIQLNDFHLKTGWILNVIWLLSLLSYKCLSTLAVMDCGHIDGWKEYCITIRWWRVEMFDVGPLRNSHKSFQTFQWHFITGWMLKQKLAFQRAFLFALHSGSIVHKVLVQCGFWKVGMFAVNIGFIAFHCVSLDFTGFHWKLILQSNWTFVWLDPINCQSVWWQELSVITFNGLTVQVIHTLK